MRDKNEGGKSINIENVLEVSNKKCVNSTKNIFIYTEKDFQDMTSKICPHPIPCWENTLSYID